MDLLNALQEFLVAAAGLVHAVVATGAPWLPLLAWIAFWLLAVNWSKLFPELERLRVTGVFPLGMLGIFLLGFLTVLIWGVIAPPDQGAYNIFGLRLSNLVGKTVNVTGLFVIAAMCGSVQMSGMVSPWCLFDEPEVEDDHGHGHEDHHGGHQNHDGHHATSDTPVTAHAHH